MQKPYFGPKRLPSIKRYLIGLHLDLERIEKYVADHEVDDLFYERLYDYEKIILLLEDRRYFWHRGIDLVSITRVLLQAFVGRRRGGASTIEMQFVRRATGRYEKTLRRKAREMVLAILLGYRMNKTTIFRKYLACAYFGYGLRGVASASYAVFDRPPWNLSVEEGAFLAALMVYPYPRQQTAEWRGRADRRARYGLALFRKFHERFDNLKVA